MATIEQLQAEIVELKEQITMLKRLMGETGGAFRSLGVSTNSVLKPFASLVDAASSGATGLSVYTQTLATTTDLIGKFGEKLGAFGSILAAMGDAGGAYVQAAAQQGDALYKTYQELAIVGAAGQEKADALTGRPEGSNRTFDVINDLANQFGIVSAKDLPKFAQMIGQSSETLAKFGGTVYDGMKAFGSLANSVQNTGLQTEFLNMGMTVDSINKGLAGYLKMQTLGAAGQMRTQQELNAGAGEYIRNLDMLSKLTGKNVEQLQKEQEDILLDEKYSIHQRQLEQKAAAGDLEAKQQLAEEMKAMAQAPDSVKKGLQAAFTGYGMQFEEGRKLYMSAPEAFNQAAKGVGFNANQFFDTAKGEFKRTMDTFGDLIMAAGNSLFVFVGDMRKIENLQGTAEEREARAREIKRRQTAETSADVAGSTALGQMQRDATRDLTNFVNIGVLPAIHFLGQLAETARNVTSGLPGAKPLTTEQQQRQGYGPQVGRTGTSGATAADVESAAKNATNKNIEEYDARMKKLDEQLTQLRDRRDAVRNTGPGDATERAAIDKEIKDIGTVRSIMSDFLSKMRPATPRQQDDGDMRPLPVIVPPADPQRRDTSALPSSEVLAANISRGIINIASADRTPGPSSPGPIPSPAMLAANISRGIINIASADRTPGPVINPRPAPPSITGALPSSEVLAANISRGIINIASADMLTLMKEPGKTSESVPVKTQSDSDVIASNTMLAGKMDELIGLMRTSGGYLQKISLKDYA